MKIIFILILSLLWIQLYACDGNDESKGVNNSNEATNTDTMKLKITIGSKVFAATLDDNASTEAFKSLLPMAIDMAELNGNEKYYDLSDKLPQNASNPGIIQTGDLMLYGSSTLVFFYKTFSTPYSYTRLGRVDDITGLAAAVGSGNVTVTVEVSK